MRRLSSSVLRSRHFISGRHFIRAQRVLLLAALAFISACNFVDPGEKTEIPYSASEIRLPIYQSGDFLEYTVSGFNSVGGIDGAEIYGTLRITYGTNAENILPTDLTGVNVNDILKETTTLDIGSRYTAERFVYQIKDSADPLYGAMYFIAISNQLSNTPSNLTARKYSWAGSGTTIAPTLVMNPVVFANVGADSILDPVNFNLYIDCDSTGTILSSCTKDWLSYSENSQLTSRGNGSYGYFYDAKTYKTAVITKTWNLNSSTYAQEAGGPTGESFSASKLDYSTFCANIPADSQSAVGSGEYHYLPQVGLVTMSTLVCAGNSTSSAFYRFNIISLRDGIIGGVALQDIL